MEVEMDNELERKRCQRSEERSGQARNYRNGYSKKTVKTQPGEVDIKVPRDRQGKYEPKIIGKYDRNAEGMEEKILALYACGMSQRDKDLCAYQDRVGADRTGGALPRRERPFRTQAGKARTYQ